MVTSFASGLLMFVLHKVANRMPDYSVFVTLLQAVTLMGIPAAGLQSTFTQQAAASLHGQHERQLASVFLGVLRATLFIWLLMVAVIFVFRGQIVAGLKIENPAALWITVVIGLLAMWTPMLLGMLQGRQNFAWLGWASILNGITRFGGVCVGVLWLSWHAAGAMVAVLAGMTAVVALAAWQTRDLWKVRPEPIHWRSWLSRVLPLTLGLGALTFMLSADMIFVQKYFQEGTKYYAAAGMIGRALVFFTQPLAMVMFPKLVRSAAKSEKSDALAHALLATLLAGGLAAIGCTILPWLPMRIVYDQTYLDISTPLVPWFAWAMLPLTLSMVLANALLAHSRFSVVPWLAAIGIGYGITLFLELHFSHGSFTTVIQTLGIFSALMLAVCSWFTWGCKPKTYSSQ
jgi:O-antigen/teichoic acid export membrane protein